MRGIGGKEEIEKLHREAKIPSRIQRDFESEGE